MTHRTKRLGRIDAQRLLIIFLCALAGLAFFPKAVSAHPMGNFSVNRYSRLSVESEGVELFYIVDMAEIPTHAERNLMDIDGDTTVSTEEAQRYLDNAAATLPAQLLLTVDGEPATWTMGEHTIHFVPGQADLPTLRMEFTLRSTLPAGSPGNDPKNDEVQELRYHDTNYAERVGWQEVILAPNDGVDVLASDVPQDDLSNMLQEYPVDLLQDPPMINSATIRWQFDANLSGQQTQLTTEIQNSATQNPSAMQKLGATVDSFVDSLGSDGFAELISIELGPWAIVLALLAAFGWGAAHALSPGHGKTIVAAYLVGARGTFAHALFLGATTTITHTLGVFLLGLATLVASQYILPERIYPWLSTISGLLVITIGISIGWNRLRELLRGQPVAHEHHHHEHADHEHSHDHAHDHDHTHSHGGHTHSHMPIDVDGNAVTWRGLLALGISGGLLPCPSALVVLLGAIALGRVAFGLVLILVFSLGLATVLTAFGLLLLRAGKLFERIPESGRYARYLAVGSAAFITLVGVGITVRALIEVGVFAGLA